MGKSLLFSLDGRKDFCETILEKVNSFNSTETIVMGELNIQKFSDGELSVDFKDCIRGAKVFIVSSPNNSDEIIKLMLCIDAAKRANASEIILVLPFFPYQRSDKKDQSRGPIGAKVMAEMIEQRGSTSVITYDLHADQIQGFFNIPVTHIEGKHVFDSYINQMVKESNGEVVLCGPDAGSGKRVKRIRDQVNKRYGVNLNIVMIDKTRKQANVIDEMIIIGDVKDKHVIILDDMVDTAGTLCKAAEVLIQNGAKTVNAGISHGVLSGPAHERISNSLLKELVISDSLESKDNDKILIASVTEQIGLAISASINNLSYEVLKSKLVKI